jgi:DNA-binding MarR family transcriptional regulator
MVKHVRDIAELAQEIEADLRAIQQTMRKPLAAANARGKLTAPQRSIMQILVRSEGLSLKELSRQAALAHSTVSGIIDRLERRGMVIRQPDNEDGRCSRIVVTEPVRDFVRNKLPDLTTQPLVKGLRRASLAERRKISEGLRSLRYLLDRV